tara:strand:+ start:1804 stop:2154 length:351 start_codon:yes stop_codon:yes gene_type:complete
MANTFRVITNVMPASADTADAIYTVPSSTTAVVNSMVIANVHTADVTVDVEVQSDTSGAGRTATNGNVTLLNGVSIPVNTTLEILHKLVLEATDVLLVDCSTTNGAAVTLSYLEIT